MVKLRYVKNGLVMSNRILSKASIFFIALFMLTFSSVNASGEKGSAVVVSFEAVNIGNHVDISWTTTSEANSGFYTVERSSDGMNFIEITRVGAAGNSFNRLDYMEVDKDPLPGISIYRLKHTDVNGEYSFSNEVVVKRRDCSGYLDLTGNNTPAAVTSAELPLLFGFSAFGNEETLVVVRDKSGNEFYSKVMLINDHGKIICFDPDGKMNAGEYTIIASADDQLYSFNVTVK